MAIISALRVKNFKCFREEVQVSFTDSSYLIGANNAGKSSILKALQCFFDEDLYVESYINSTEFTARKTGYNRSEITVILDRSAVKGATRQKQYKKDYSAYIEFKKTFTYKEISNTIDINYYIDGNHINPESHLPKYNLIFNTIEAISLSYIHPQEGVQLLSKAQEKFKTRLFYNWGKHASVAEQIKSVEEKWAELRSLANSYLSSTLTTQLREIWPEAEVLIDLPASIKDVVAISDISFKSHEGLPIITLSEQGSGVQATVLYQTHYILDSDKSLHKGEYYPVWLLEEPESFLHADIATQLGALLNSHEWLESIQMIVSTHSPLILAPSQQNISKTSWVVLEDYVVKSNWILDALNEDDIQSIGTLLGDPNFALYFELASTNTKIYIEDSKKITKDKFIEAGLPITKGVQGTSDIERLLIVLTALPELISGETYVILDNDKGISKFQKYLTNEIKQKEECTSYEVVEGLYIITLPENTAAEHLFNEYDSLLEEKTKLIFDDKLKMQKNIPSELVRAAATIKGKQKPSSFEDAKALLQNEQEIKDIFWENVKTLGYSIQEKYVNAIKYLMDLE